MRRVLVLVAAILAAGCDTGGLLVVESVDAGPDAGPVVLGPNANEFVNGGTVASNAKFRVVYTLGQPTPNQDSEKGANSRLNGGLVGATEGK